jgi:hypothetical protein
MCASRFVLSDVPRLVFGRESDVFTNAVTHVLNVRGHGDVKYHDLLGASGRGFLVCWDPRAFFWNRYGDKPDADPELYLRTDLSTLAAVASAAGHTCKILTTSDCAHPLPPSEHARAVEGASLREIVVGELTETNSPVVALMSLSPTIWAPEWSLVTGYDDEGRVLTGWSCFQDDAKHAQGVDFEPSGYFRRNAWERDLVAIVTIGRERDAQRSEAAHGRAAVERAIAYGQPSTRDEQSWGIAAYDTWAASLVEQDNGTMGDDVLSGRLEYHGSFVGHLAAQKWFSGEFLSHLPHSPWTKSGLLHAAACCARIHELMWECWRVAGGYWRDHAKELAKFRTQSARGLIAALVREAKEADREALRQLGLALDNWGKDHGAYMD